MDRIEAVVTFAPVPHLMPAQLRETVAQVDRGAHGPTWMARDEVAHDPARRAGWDTLRRRFEHVFPLGERWQLDQVLALAGDDDRLVHLHDLAADLAEGTYAAGTVLADVPSAVAGEATEMVARLAQMLETHPSRGCQVLDIDGQPAWSGVALAGTTTVRGRHGGLVLHPDGRLELSGVGVLHAWEVSPEGVTATVAPGTDGAREPVTLDHAQGGWLRSLAPHGAWQVRTCRAAEAAAEVVVGLADGLATSVQFQRSLLLERAR